MHCAAIRKQLNRYHDAELEPGARVEVERHLAGCTACRAALAQLEGAAGWWAAVKTPSVPEGFAERLMRRARKRRVSQPQRAWASWPLLRWWWEQSLAMRAAAAAVLVVAVFVGAFLGFSSGPPAQVSGAAQPANPLAENMAFLTATPHGSLEQSYLALAFPADSTRNSP